MYLQLYPDSLKDLILELESVVHSNMLNARSLKIRPYISLIIDYTSWLPESAPMIQRFHAIKNNIFSIPKCPRCDKKVNFQRELKHYHIYCSRKCLIGSGLLSIRSVDHWNSLPETEKEKRRMHAINIMNNRSHRYSSKEFVFPSGKIVKVQGTEPKILKGLLEVFNESDIIVGRDLVPVIFYTFNNKQHRHYPDIFVKSKNMLIDAKSDWTYFQNLKVNHAKQDAARSEGYSYWFAFG